MKTYGLRVADIIVQENEDGSAELTSSLHSDYVYIQGLYDSIEERILLDWAKGEDIISPSYHELIKKLLKCCDSLESAVNEYRGMNVDFSGEHFDRKFEGCGITSL